MRLSTLHVYFILGTMGLSCVNKKEALQAHNSFIFDVNTPHSEFVFKNGNKIDVFSYQLTAKEATENAERFLTSPILKNGAHGQEYYAEYLKDSSLTEQERKLRLAEFMGLRVYTLNAFNLINKYLANETVAVPAGSPPFPDSMEMLIRSAVSALNTLPKYKGESFFGANMRDQGAFKETLKQKKSFSNQNFTSTSMDIAVAFRFSMPPDESAIVFSVQSEHGVDISKTANLKDEKEILFPPGMSFKVVKMEEATIQGFPITRVSLVEDMN